MSAQKGEQKKHYIFNTKKGGNSSEKFGRGDHMHQILQFIQNGKSSHTEDSIKLLKFLYLTKEEYEKYKVKNLSKRI